MDEAVIVANKPERKPAVSLADQVRALQLRECPQSIVRIDGNILVKTTSTPASLTTKHESRLMNVANGASIKNFDVIREDRVVFTFHECPNLQVGIYKNLSVHDKTQPRGGVTMYFQTQGSRFFYEVFFLDCNVLVYNQTETEQISDRQVKRTKQKASLRLLREEKELYDRKSKKWNKEKAEQNSKQTKTEIRKQKNVVDK